MRIPFPFRHHDKIDVHHQGFIEQIVFVDQPESVVIFPCCCMVLRGETHYQVKLSVNIEYIYQTDALSEDILSIFSNYINKYGENHSVFDCKNPFIKTILDTFHRFNQFL